LTTVSGSTRAYEVRTSAVASVEASSQAIDLVFPLERGEHLTDLQSTSPTVLASLWTGTQT